jgi:HK97 family phage prohead protease
MEDVTPLEGDAERRRKDRHRKIPLMPEVRFWKATGLEIRTNAKTDEIVISGSPIVYNADYRVMDMFGEFTERMMPGVARDVLANTPDVRFLFDHGGLPLARSIAGTLSLQDSDEALRFTASLDARQQLANDLAIAIERGDVSQMSCGFIVARDEWDEAMEDRSIHALADLLDVSAVTYPASPTTSIAVAQRMMFAAPIESRARLRQFYLDGRAGKTLAPERFEAFRSMLGADLDPGDATQTPDGTGRLGHPVGNGRTWADLGGGLPSSTPADGTGGGTGDYATAPATDGTGSRSDDAPKTSRATALRVKRALRGI